MHGDQSLRSEQAPFIQTPLVFTTTRGMGREETIFIACRLADLLSWKNTPAYNHGYSSTFNTQYISPAFSLLRSVFHEVLVHFLLLAQMSL